jgi:hypothetical protein
VPFADVRGDLAAVDIRAAVALDNCELIHFLNPPLNFGLI